MDSYKLQSINPAICLPKPASDADAPVPLFPDAAFPDVEALDVAFPAVA